MEKVAVILGGKSPEREISFKTGEAVYQALLEKNYKAIKIDGADKNLVEELLTFKPDIVFIALHGRFGEDGTIQGLLETLELPYTGCGVFSSALAMDKIYTKKILKYENIPTADFLSIHRRDYKKEGITKIAPLIKEKLGYPVVVKAPTQGSSIGIYFINEESELEGSLEKAFSYDNEILIEKCIKGPEVTISVIGNENPLALPSLEIVSKTDYYDYEAKYTVGMSDHIIPARISKELEAQIKEIAVDTYQALNCRGFARVDFMLENDCPYVLEINTIPGMTETSLLPDAARAIGIEFPDLVEKIINYGLGKED